MSDRPGQIAIVDNTGTVLFYATAIKDAGATGSNGVALLSGSPGGGGTNALSYKGASAPSAAEFNVLADLTGRLTIDANAVELRSANSVLTVGDNSFGLLVNNDSWIVFDEPTHSMDLGDVDGWGNLTHIAIEDDDEQVRLHATTVKVEKGLLEVGVAGADLGRLKLAGNTSGVVTIQPAAAAGAWTLQLPANAGTNRFPLLTNGSGVTSWAQLGASDISGLGTAATLNVGTASGDIPVLGSGGKLASSVIPALAISETFVVASQAAMLALSAAETGDVAVRTDVNKSFILAGTNPGTLAHWQELLTPTDAVTSVNGQTGVVVLTTSDVAEGSNLYYTAARFNTAFAGKSTADLAEGSNLYFTNERVDDRVAALVQGTTNQITPTYDDGAGTLTLSLPQNIHTGASPTFTGLTLSGNISAAGVSSSLIPSVTDTYDLGSATKLWRKGYLSELDAVLFAKNTVSLVGGWLRATKNEGAIPVGQDVGTGDTTIDFGQAMTPNDFVEFRAAGSVEYVQVGTLSSGTRYNVTRNLDGSGANAWPAGSVYAVNGYTGNGRIDINANATPRISVFQQGVTYNAQTEVVRVGDLNGWGAYGAETYGFAAGEYGSTSAAWATVDASNGFRAGRNTTTVWQVDTSGNMTLGQVANNSGNAYWNNSNKRLEFRGSTGGTVVQAYINTDGSLRAANDKVSIDVNGIRVTGTGQAYSFVDSFSGGATIGALTTNYDASNVQIDLEANGGSSRSPVLNIVSTSNTGGLIQMTAVGGAATAYLSLSSGVSGAHVATTSVTRLSIGDAAYPSHMLHVAGTARITSTLQVDGALSLPGGVSGNVAFDTNTLYVDATNNRVGIGTASPAQQLTVSSAADTKMLVTTTGAVGTGYASVTLSSTGATGSPYLEFQLVPSSTDKQSYVRYNYVGNGGGTIVTDILVVKGNGCVGVGTNAPLAALDVNGNASIRGGNAWGFNKYYDAAGATDRVIATGFAGDWYQDASTGRMAFRTTGASVAAGGAIVMADRVSINAAGTLRLHAYGAGTPRLDASGNMSVVAAVTVTGSRGGNAALASLLTQLASAGFIVDNTTA